MYGIPYMWNPKRYHTNELTEQKRFTDSENELTVAKGKEQFGRLEWTCTHCYIEMDTQQAPTVQHRELCSVLDGSLDERGAWGGEWIQVYVWLSSFAIHLKLSQY